MTKQFFQMLSERSGSFTPIAVHLWLISSHDNTVTFTMADITHRFKISKSSFYSFLQAVKEMQCPLTSENGAYKLKFVGNTTKPHHKVEDNAVYLEFLKDFYGSHKIDYPNLEKQGKTVTMIKGKIKSLMPKDSTDEDLFNSFQMFFKKIPEWWIINAFMLQSINKSFPKIYEQIKRGNSDKSIAGAVEKQTIGVNYSKFTKAASTGNNT